MAFTQSKKRFEPAHIDLSKLFDKLPPHAIEAEMSLLGSMMVAGTENIHIVGEVMEQIKSGGDFFLPKHGAIFDALTQLYDQNNAIDLVQLTQRLRDAHQEEEVGGVDYLIELAESVPTSVNAPHYARIVRDKAKLRFLIDASSQIMRDAHVSDEEANLIIDKAESLIFEIAQFAEANKPSALNELMHETFELLDKRKDVGRSITGVASSYQQLDEMLAGFQPGEMTILAARPSMGKTALALNIAEHIAVDCKIPTAVFSIEMGKQQLSERLLSSRSGVDSQKLRRAMMNENEWVRLQEVAGELSESPMYIDDTPSLSVLELRSKARRLASQHDVKMIVIDYLQLMSAPGAESRQNEVGMISRGIKALARELHVPVLCLAQLNRNPDARESKIPMLSDLRESGSIEQDADVVMLLHREEYYHKDPAWAEENPGLVGMAQVVIAKQRNGPTGVAPLKFDGATVRFSNPPHPYIDEDERY
ncbi:MAG: replicative DNA helicase [Planctomycetota bacterium]